MIRGLVLGVVALATFGFASLLDANPPAEVKGDQLPMPIEEQVDSTDHWAYQPIKRPELPATVNAGVWAHHPIDRFIRARQAEAGIEMPKAATPRELVRRVYLDLIGLPPSPEAVDAFIADSSTAHYERIIESLLASPRYGERWARHWLDVVRYADTNGYEFDSDKPFTWRYRDYVVNAFNTDMPYDQFVIEQLAGDELDDANADTFVATSYIRLGLWDAERGASVQKNEKIDERANELDDMVATTSQVFLGLTLGCARCHDHKFDALTARDYYSMVAIFNPLKRPHESRTDYSRPVGTRAQLAAKEKADAQVAKLWKTIDDHTEDLRNAWFDSNLIGLPPSPEAVDAFIADSSTAHYERIIESLPASPRYGERWARHWLDLVREEIPRLKQQIASIKPISDLPEGYIMWEPSPEPPTTHLLIRGSARQPGEEVPPAVPAVLASRQPEFLEPSTYTSRRRLTLARWLVRMNNPLTPRVIVNRIWQWHFGHGLVRTPNEFGVRGDLPSHPKLLDWLSHWFRHDAGWSMKKLNRLIMTSRTYRISKRWNEVASSIDPNNRLLWRFPYRRLEFEAIRDSILAVSGRLNLKMAGPSTYPYFPEEAKQGSFTFGKAWKAFDENEASRRTLYAYIKRTMMYPMSEALDFCDTSRSAGQRDITTVAPQALMLINGEFVNRQAGYLAKRLVREVGTDPDRQIEQAYRLALGRKPSTDELADFKHFITGVEQTLSEQTPKANQDEISSRALMQACRAIFNLNEFVYTD